jgi:hypothetical protein
MIKYVVVPATGTAVDMPVFATALAVARLLPAHLEFLHVRLDVQTVLTAMAANDVSGGAGYDQMLESLERDVGARQKAAETAFRDFCEEGMVPVSSDPATDLPSAELRMETGDEPTCLAAHGRAADLVVIGREREGDENTGGLPDGDRPAGPYRAHCRADLAVRSCRYRMEGCAGGRRCGGGGDAVHRGCGTRCYHVG